MALELREVEGSVGSRFKKKAPRKKSDLAFRGRNEIFMRTRKLIVKKNSLKCKIFL